MKYILNKILNIIIVKYYYKMNENSVLPLEIFKEMRNLIETYAKSNAKNKTDINFGINIIENITYNKLKEWSLTLNEIKIEIELWKFWYIKCYHSIDE